MQPFRKHVVFISTPIRPNPITMKQIFTLSILLAASTVCTHAQKTILKSFSNIKTITLSTSSGDISVVKSIGTEVKLTVLHSYDDDVFTPIIEEKGGTLTLKEEFARGSHSGNSSWSLAIPDNTTLKVNSGSGDFSIEGISSEVKSNLGSGDAEVSGVTGKLEFNNGSGDFQLTDCAGTLALNAGSGTITVRGGSGTFNLNAGSGDIRLNRTSGTFDVNTGSGDVEAESVALRGAGKFNSGSGDALVYLSGSLDFNISINSGSGDATLNFNGAPIEGEVIATVNKSNGEIVAPFKFDKEETIEEHGSSPRIRKTAKLGTKDIVIKIGSGSGTARITK
jgi:DUF4097 and DUF4098 domain-containing protein YvlB